jgi:WhiB family transcriptional regulator, redox-sensing transcriptional regulator
MVGNQGTTRSWPASLEEFWDWQVDAACRDMGAGLFFSPEGERGSRRVRRELAAKAICATCQVRELCAAYAIATREPYGTWGGLSETERRELAATVDAGQAAGAYRTALRRWVLRAQASQGQAAAVPRS